MSERARWFAAWVSGSAVGAAVTAFVLGHPGLGWAWVGLSAVMPACDLVLYRKQRSR